MIETLIDLANLIVDNPLLGVVLCLLGLAASLKPAWAAFTRALERRADQMWTDHGPDDDPEIAVQRVTDKLQASAAWMSMTPRRVVEAQVRAKKESRPPGPPVGKGD